MAERRLGAVGVLHRRAWGLGTWRRDRVMFGGSHEAGRVVRRSSCRPGESMKSPGVRRQRPARSGVGRLGVGGVVVVARPGAIGLALASRLRSVAAVGSSDHGCVESARDGAGSLGAWRGVQRRRAPEPAPPETSPTASDSASSEPSTPAPSPSVEGPPEMPEAAKGTSKKSAEAFVRYAVEVLNYTALSARTEPLRRISQRVALHVTLSRIRPGAVERLARCEVATGRAVSLWSLRCSVYGRRRDHRSSS